MAQSPPLKLHQPPASKRETPIITSWMVRVLQFAGWYNIVAGLAMMTMYHEGFKFLGLAKPEMNLPIQLVGLLVGIFGVGYLIASRDAVENRNLVFVGFLSKLLGPLLALGYVASGKLPGSMIPVLIFADLIYLFPFWMIYRRSCQIAAARETVFVTSLVDADGKNRAA